MKLSHNIHVVANFLSQVIFDCLIFEMFFIQELKPTLNKQCDSIRAKLFV